MDNDVSIAVSTVVEEKLRLERVLKEAGYLKASTGDARVVKGGLLLTVKVLIECTGAETC